MTARRARRRWFTPTSAALLAIVLGFAGFYAGVREEKAQATGTGSTSSISRTAAARSRSARASTGAGTASASASGITAGTVTRVDGNTVYVKEASGATVQVKLLATTAIDKTQNVSGHSVRPGDTVTVQGTQGSGGTIKSSSISDSGNTSTATTSTSQSAATSSTG
jgi:endonuclease YncB( thermonuclease family)